MEKLINYFSREIGVPYRLKVKNIEEFLKLVNQNNGIKTIYYSLYDYPYEQCKLDKIHFDLDKEDALTAVKILHDYCKFENLKHLMIFSGRKYQFYIFTKNYDNIIDKKNCLRNAQESIAKQCNLTIGDPKTCNIDFHLIGDIARLVRVPNTMHLSTHLYCIPLSEEDLQKGELFIKQKARKQNFNFVYYNDDLLDIKKFDCEYKKYNYTLELDKKTEILIDEDKILKKLPLCISKMLLNDYIPWRQRFHIITYLREKGFSYNNIIRIFEKYLRGKKHPEKNHDNFEHCIKHESNQVKRIYETDNYFFSCKKIYEEGLCVKGCKQRIYL